MKRRRIRGWIAAVAIALLCAPLLTGCVTLLAGGAAAAAGTAGAVAYVRGEYRGTLEASFERSSAALLEAARLFMLKQTAHRPVSGGERYTFRDFQDTKVAVTLKSLAPNTTQMYVRIGVFGDRDYSQRVFDAVRRRLDESARPLRYESPAG